MARTWRDYAPDNSDNRDKCPDQAPATAPIVPNGPIVSGLPDNIRDGLAALAGAPAPRLLNAHLWPIVVSDALRLGSDGWTTQALRLGWSELDLFGAVADKSGDPSNDGLAVKLRGRKILAMCASFATVEEPNGRAWLHRGSNVGARLLWEIGRSIR